MVSVIEKVTFIKDAQQCHRVSATKIAIDPSTNGKQARLSTQAEGLNPIQASFARYSDATVVTHRCLGRPLNDLVASPTLSVFIWGIQGCAQSGFP